MRVVSESKSESTTSINTEVNQVASISEEVKSSKERVSSNDLESGNEN